MPESGLARNMVGLWGMSDVGPVTVITENGALPCPVPATRHLLEQAQEQVTQPMSTNRDKLDALAQELLKRETLEHDEAYAVAGIEPHPNQRLMARLIKPQPEPNVSVDTAT
jgi:cell division protease FtsH